MDHCVAVGLCGRRFKTENRRHPGAIGEEWKLYIYVYTHTTCIDIHINVEYHQSTKVKT